MYYLTESEWKAQSISFRNFYTRALNLVLERASEFKINLEIKDVSEREEHECGIYQGTATAPSELNLTVGTA